MAGITLAQAEAQLAYWLEASASNSSKQSYSIKDRAKQLAQTDRILEMIKYWDGKVKELTLTVDGSGVARTGNIVVGYEP